MNGRSKNMMEINERVAALKPTIECIVKKGEKEEWM